MMVYIYLVFFIIIIVTIGIMQCLGHGFSAGDPRLLWLAVPLLLLYTIDSWRDKKELIRRFGLALPFALLFIILAKVEGFNWLLSLLAGGLLLEAMVTKTNHWKWHFIVTLICAMLLFISAVTLKRVELKFLNIYVLMGCAFGVIVFYQSYITRLTRTEKYPDLQALSVDSVKLAIVYFVALSFLTVSHILCRQHHISFVISFAISVLIALSFLGLCKLFNIKNPACSGRTKKKNGLGD